MSSGAGRDKAEESQEGSSPVISFADSITDLQTHSSVLRSAVPDPICAEATDPAIGTGSVLTDDRLAIVNSSLCSVCSSIFDGDPSPRPQYTHHKTMKSLRDAASNGCPTCTLTVFQVEDVWHGGENINLTWCFEATSKSDKRAFGQERVILTQSFTDNYGTTQEGHVKVRSSINSSFVRSSLVSPIPVPKPDISDNTGSVSSLALAKKWLAICTQTHENCRNPKVKWYPTRLLDISGTDTYLVSTLDLKLTEWYGTLSHCSGSNVFLTLTTENLQELQDGFQTTILPKTFQHAIQVAKRLGLKYLWIDSLCIIQDSEDDWLHESAMMEDVYRHSYCNIAATAASNGGVGLFFDRNLVNVRPIQVTVSKAVKLRDGQLFSGVFDIDFGRLIWSNNIKQSPLLKRAWVAQERILAPRILHFGKEQILWECDELVACETFPEGFWGGFDAAVKSQWRPTVQSLKTSLAETIKIEGYGKTEKLREWWQQFQNEYMSMSLTKPSDRLPAMSGIAQAFQRVSSWKFLAGHWNNEFESQLLWYCAAPSTGAYYQYRYQPPLGPTWSWVSVHGQCRLPSISRNRSMGRASVQSVSVALEHSDNPFGQVTGGEIVLKGYLKSADFILGVLNLKPTHGSSAALGARYWNEHWTDGREHILVFFDECIEGSDAGSLFCLRLIDGQVRKSYYTQWGLVLRQTSEPGVYTRIGMFKANLRTTNKFLRRQRRNPQPPPIVEVEGRTGDHPVDQSTKVVFNEPVNYSDETQWEDIPWQTIKIV